MVTMRCQTTQILDGYKRSLYMRHCVYAMCLLNNVHTMVDLVIFSGQAEQSFLFICN